MADERAAKLKLKRKKGQAGAPAPTGLQGARGPRLQPQSEKALTTSSYWFEGEGLSELHSVWKEVLNAAYPDLKSRNWDSMPSFPKYPQKCSDQDTRKTEVFKVGPKEFKWTDFPSVTQETKAISVIPELQQVVDSLPDHLKVEDLDSKTIPIIIEKSKIDTNHPPETIRAEQSTHPPKTSKKGKVEVPKQHRLKNPTQNAQNKSKLKVSADIHSSSISTMPQNLTKASGFERLFKTNSQSEKETEGASSHGKQTGCIILDDDISVVQDEHSAVDFPSEKVNEGTASLQSCPICCLQFAEGFTPMEIDSHLAKCLSESTEDIMW